jgi:hypothetical protein
MHASQEPHAETPMHASQEPHAETSQEHAETPMHASQEPHAERLTHACISEPHVETSAHPLVPNIRDDVSFQSDQISYLISESDSEDIEHADDEPDQRPKWAQSILPTTDYLVMILDPRRTRSQFEGDPHALTTT